MMQYKIIKVNSVNKTIGNLFVIAAPSGAGKTSLVAALSESLDDFRVSISYTTRAIRPGEVDGCNYFFVDHAQFDAMVAQQAFLEHASVFGNQYGTSRAWVLAELSVGTDVVLEIDWQGARQIKALFPEAVLIFILPPSIETLSQRLKQRKQDQPEIIEKRMCESQSEMQHFAEFDYLIVNDQFDAALLDLQHIVHATRLKTQRQMKNQAILLENLLKKP